MQHNWVNKIHNLETPPTTEAWLNIAQELDRETILKIKLFDYETNSPISILKNIFKQLDAQ